ncbi:MAG: rhomboid family intramembrane serine protease [Desulfohalobiaceae bacterium]|nr:rhomboid family intramembrane serine protease [Desulfohalobiaceae bacterium]
MLFPVVGEFDRKYVPWVTVFLILVNLVVFFTLQAHDSRYRREAMRFYLNSDLAGIEYAYYQKFTGEGSVSEALQRVEDPQSEVPAPETVHSMLGDGSFRKAMRSGGLIGPGDPKFEKWSELHSTFQDKRSRIASRSYGLIPASPRPWSWVTHMFLHGGLGHLLGNMLFLWLVGYVLETGAGHFRFAGTYLVGGLLAAAMFWACNRHMAFPLIGASGAISGVMGAMTLMYGLYRIKVFINLGFFFHYVSIPALALLPVWLGKEGYHLLRSPESSVAFTAHIGGLLGGALIGWINRRFLSFDPARIFEREPDRVSPLLEEAMASVRSMDFSTARARLRQVLNEDPGHSIALKQLFFLQAQDPSVSDLSQLANRTFRALLRTGAPYEEVERIYADYCHRDSRVVLEPDIALGLASQFLQGDRADLGEPLLVQTMKSSVPLQDAPTVLFRYGRHYGDRGQERKSRACFQALLRRFPDSLEARMVQSGEDGTQGTE